MTNALLYTQLQALNPSMRNEVYDFMNFLLTKQKKPLKINTPVFGCAKGRFKMTDDFDAPLNDFNAYMY